MRLIRDGENRGKGVWRWGKREIIYLSLHCHHQNDFCIKMGSDESHFNASVGSDGQSHRTVSTNQNLLAVVSVLFYTLTKGITPNICWYCLVLMNSVLLNLLCVWILYSFLL